MKKLTGYIHAAEKSGARVSMTGQWEDGLLAVDVPAVARRPRQDGPAPARVMFIDAAVRDRTTLLDGLEADATAYVLDPNRDGLQQIAAVLARHQNLQAVSIFAHGLPGRVALGSGCLDQEGLPQHEANLRSIGRAIAPGGVLQLAACEAGRGPEGLALIQALFQHVGRAVAASSQRLGGDEGGGNWTLDVEAVPGACASALPIAAAVLQSYAHALSGAAAPPAGFPLDITDFSAPAAGGGSFVDGGSAGVSGTALQLTPDANSKSGIAVYNQSFSSALGLSVQFTYNSSGGDGADGISFFLLNGDTIASANSVTPGGFGGGLGYSNNNSGGTGGITGGFLGVGFDTYGNYAKTDHGQSPSGIAGSTANYIGVRGAYNAATPYGWLTGVPYSPGIDGTRNVQVNVQEIDATHEHLQVYMEPSGSSTYTKVIDTTVSQALPSKFYFGFAASTGGSTDLHLIDAVSVKLPTDLTFGTAMVQDVTTGQANPAALNPGDTFTYTYTLTNNGPNDDGQITVNDLLPANITGATWTVQDSSGTHSGTGPAISANLVNGAAATITVTGRVDPNSTSGNADHTVTFSPGAAYSLVNPNEATGVTLNIGHGGSSVSLVGANQVVTTTDASPVAPFASASVVDTYATPDTGATPVDTMTVQVAPGAGTLEGTGTTYNASTGTLTASGTAAQLQTVLRSITFTPTAHSMVPGSTAPVSISVTVTDSTNQTGGASATASQAATAMVTATHDTPAIAGASANQAVNDNATIAPFSGIAVTDPDLTGATLAVTVINGSVKGSFTAGSSADWSRSTAPNGDLTYTLMLGTQPNIGAAAQAALRSLVFQPVSLTSLRGGTETVGFTVTVTDTATPVAGVTDTNSSVLVRDVTPPAAPVSLLLAPASDSGTLGDGITSVALPTLTGAAEPGSTVKLYDGATLIGTGTADPATGAWSIAATVPLTVGLNTLTATSTDAAGNTSVPSSPLAITLDTTAPTVTAALAHDTGVSATDRVTADPTLAGSGDPGAIVTLTEGGAVLGTTTADPSGAWSFRPTLADGAHSIVVSETDAAGNTGTATTSLTLDTTAPTVTAVTASPGTVTAGQVVLLALSTNQGVTIAGGMPTLTLNNGGVATYDPTASTPTNLVFRYTVASGQDTADLSVTGLNLAGATITNTAGKSANLAGVVASPAGVLQVNTGVHPFTPLVTNNPDPTAILTVRAAVSQAVSGTYSNLGIGSIGADGTTYTVTGTTAQVNAALAGVLLSPAQGSPAATGLTASVNDSAGSQISQLSNTGASGSILIASTSGDVVQAGPGSDTLTGAAAGNVLLGGGGNNTFIGSEAGSTMLGGTGNSTFFSRGGPTLVVGGAMRDTISAAAGNVSVVSAVGGTAVIGLGSGPALVNGRGADTIIGGSGNAVIGAHANSLVSLTSGSAVVSAADGSTVLTGSSNALVAASGAGILMFQGTGTATFIGGSGSSTVVGGTGGHSAFFGGAGGGVFSGGTGGGNVIVGGQQAMTIFGGGDGDLMFAVGSVGTILAAGTGNETLQGGYSSGNDTVYAGSGNNLIALGSGQNVVFAGSGSATVIGGAGRDLIAITSGRAGGTETLYNFKAGIDALSLQGYGAGEAGRALAGAQTVAGTATQAASTTVTLSDNTRIVFQGVSSLNASNFA